jgi:tRNA(Arg) A34 adenosine deaminase TadA
MHEELMRRAIALNREMIRADEGGPFAAVTVRDGEVVAEGWRHMFHERVSDPDRTPY